MNISAGKREFNIFSLFLHDNEAADVCPFSQWELAKKLDEAAEKLYPERRVHFVSPDESGNSAWQVWFKKDRYDDGSFPVFPGTMRAYDERTFRRSLPAELDEVLLELNKADIVL